jgi:hypothetical protein
MMKMARRSNTKPKLKIGKDEAPGMYSPGAEVEASREARAAGPAVPNFYADIARSLAERNRKRVSTYYCPNIACRTTFWDAGAGSACPSCGMLGLISEYRFRRLTEDTAGRNIVGYVDTMGRLVCSSCITNYGVMSEIGLIVYDDTEPFCHEHCEVCKEPMGQLES